MSRDYPPSSNPSQAPGYPPAPSGAPPPGGPPSMSYYGYGGFPPQGPLPPGSTANSNPSSGETGSNRPNLTYPSNNGENPMPAYNAQPQAGSSGHRPVGAPSPSRNNGLPPPGSYKNEYQGDNYKNDQGPSSHAPPQGWRPLPMQGYPTGPPYSDGQWNREAAPNGYHPPPPWHGAYGGHPPPHPPPPPPPPHDNLQGTAPQYWSSRESRVQSSSDRFNDVDGREGATSPSQIENHHRDEVQDMGCTCKKTRCLKLYCQCFGVKLYCGSNCRCLQCYNSRKHEKQRKDAMRNILSRNPSAFDTKFKKSGQAAAAAVVEAATAGPSRVLAHKLGCKCRKSACMKKYCECYAGNVKCSSNCRCMGCKNMGPSSMYDRDGAMGSAMTAREGPQGSYQAPPHVQHHGAPPVSRPPQLSRPVANHHSSSSGGEPWVAAQSLAFLKTGSSPVSEQKRAPATDLEAASMPSLAPSLSSEGTSPGDRLRRDEEDHEGAKALLMAAQSLATFGQSPPPKREHHGEDRLVHPTPKRLRVESTSTGVPSSVPVVSHGFGERHESA